MIVLRPATLEDIPAIRELIPLSVRGLSRGFYTEAQTESALRYVFGPDTQLVRDGTYLVAEDEDGLLAGCGGWSRRRTLYGGDQMKDAEDPLLDPGREAARIRAFFVHPARARQGIGTRILDACARAARQAGFRELELMATLPGVPLYESCGFVAAEPVDSILPDGVRLDLVRMTRPVEGAPPPITRNTPHGPR